MGKKITVVLISIISAFIIMDGGYGKWQKELNIEGNIKVIPNPKVLEGMETTLQELKNAEELRVAEEQRLLEMEKALEEQKKLDELLDENVEEETTQTKESSIEDYEAVDEDIQELEESKESEESKKEESKKLENLEEAEDPGKPEEQEEVGKVKEAIFDNNGLNKNDKDKSTLDKLTEEVDNSADLDIDDSSN